MSISVLANGNVCENVHAEPLFGIDGLLKQAMLSVDIPLDGD